MSLGSLGGLSALSIQDTFGILYGMFQEYNQRSGASSLFDGFSGNSSNGSSDESLWSAPANGKLKKVIINVPTNAHNNVTNVYTRVGGSQILLGNIPALTTGIFTFNSDRAFLKNDRIGWTIQTTGAGNIVTVPYYEIQLDDIGKDMMVGSSGRFFGGQFGSNYMDVPAPQNRSSGPPADTRQFEWQNRVARAGKIKDMWWYGTNPSGTGAGTIAARVNGLAEHSEILPIHAGASLDRYDNIDVPFNAGDLLGGSMVKLGANNEGTLSFRIEFD